MIKNLILTTSILSFIFLVPCSAQVAGKSGKRDLVIAEAGQTKAVVIVSPDAGASVEKTIRNRKQKVTIRTAEKQAADDLSMFIGLMTGAHPNVVSDAAGIEAALESKDPVFLVGGIALEQRKSLRKALDKVAKKKPVLRSDAIAVERAGNRVYLAGTNDESNYHAVAWLLHQWGCRWYLPTEIGQCIPTHDTLKIGSIDYAYSPPFEMRGYWISWNGNGTGARDFQLRNFMNFQRFAGQGHALGSYTKDLAEKGKNIFSVSFADPKTAQHVLEKLKPQIEQVPANGISLAIEDGSYANESVEDTRLQAGIQEKYFLKPNMTDPMMALYSNIGTKMKEIYPDNATKIGGMAYANVTIPPQWKHDIPDNLVIWLAPIDIDPIHGMDDPNSPPRQEYREMLKRWAELVDGRVCIYDYDQGMLVWRDIPNPSHFAFAQDVKHYRDAGIIGINTESRNAIATIFTNLYFRGQLMWNPDADLDGMLKEFYTTFYGPAAEPMGKFWSAVDDAWKSTIVTEHEYMAAPAIYSRPLLSKLASQIKAATGAISSLKKKSTKSPNEELYVKRMDMAQKQWDVLRLYMEMVFAAASDCNYTKAAGLGKQAMTARLAMANMNPTFTTRVVGPAAEPTEPKGSAAWFPGDVKQYIDLAMLPDGTNGKIIKPLPFEWAFRRDPNDSGLARGWAYKPADLSFWNANKDKYDLYSLKDYPTTQWEMIRTDAYAQSVGIRHPDAQSFTGHFWYKTNVKLSKTETAGKVHLMFPGIFNECWLYINGYLAGYRKANPIWWYSDYKFEWDVDIEGKLVSGENDITVRFNNPHHFGGMFRRPFLYRTK